MPARPDSFLEWVKPPQQARSAQTLERILDAAEAILLEQGLDALNVSAVAKRAQSSVGAFYARFADKDSLVRAVCERFTEQAIATIDAVLDPVRWKDQPLELVVGAGIRFMLKVASERRAVLCGLIVYHETLISQIDLLVRHFGERLYAFLTARGELPACERSEIATNVIAGVLLSTVQAHATHRPARALAVDEALMTEELTKLCLGYLRPGEVSRTPV